MKVEVSLRLSTFLPTVLITCRYTEAEAQCRMEEKKYVKVSTYGCIFDHLNYTSRFFLLFLI